MIEKMTEILNDFISNPHAVEFVFPYVDAYYDSVIKEKMDLYKLLFYRNKNKDKRKA